MLDSPLDPVCSRLNPTGTKPCVDINSGQFERLRECSFWNEFDHLNGTLPIGPCERHLTYRASPCWRITAEPRLSTKRNNVNKVGARHRHPRARYIQLAPEALCSAMLFIDEIWGHITGFAAFVAGRLSAV
jgi:hypothetical protein